MTGRRCNTSVIYLKAISDQSKPLLAAFTHSSESNSPSCLSVIQKFDYVFAENGTVQYKDGRLVSKHVSEDM